MLYRDNKSCESTKIRPIRLTNWPESHFCIQTWHIRDMLCTCNKLASSQQVFHPLLTENRNATNQSWRISTWCIGHFLPVLLSSEVLRCTSQIVIPILCCWYGNATTVSGVFCYLWYICTQSTWRISSEFFRLTIIREHRLFVSFVSSRRLLSLCYILVAPYWEWSSTDKMIHADYYIYYVGLLRGSWRIRECFGDKDCVTLFHGNTRWNTSKHIGLQHIENILYYGQNRK